MSACMWFIWQQISQTDVMQVTVHLLHQKYAGAACMQTSLRYHTIRCSHTRRSSRS